MTVGMKERSVNPLLWISKVSKKPAENTLSLHRHATTPVVWNHLCSVRTDQLYEPPTGSDPAATVAGWEQARLHATEDFLGSVNLSFYLLMTRRLQFLEWSRILAAVLIWFDLRAPCSDHKVKTQTWILSLHTLSKRTTSTIIFNTIVVYSDALAVIWTHSTWYFKHICIVAHHSAFFEGLLRFCNNSLYLFSRNLAV